jgi:hypothetical protein
MPSDRLPTLSSRSPALFAAVAVFLASVATVAADPVLIKSYQSPCEVQRAQVPEKWFPVRVGLELKDGDTVRTGRRGKADLSLSDGSRMSLGPESQMQVKETAGNRLFGLDFGRMKSFVKKLKGGSKFEVRTPLAAASVRGTVFETGYDAESKEGFVEVDDGVVGVTMDGREVFVNEGERVGFAPGELGTPAPQTSAEEGDERSAVRREVGLGMSKEEVMAAAAEEMRLAEYQEGKTLIDVNGQRVRLQEYIIRKPKELPAADQDKAFKLVALNERDDRFDYFYYRGVFNTALPDDLSVALSDINGKLGTTAPTYFLTAYEQGQSNTRDSIKDNASGGHLVKISYDGTRFTLVDPTNASNTRTIVEDEETVVEGVTYHKIYDPVNDRFVTVTGEQFLAGDFRPAVYNPTDDTFKYIASGDTYWRGRYNSYSHKLNDVAKQSYAAKSTVNGVAGGNALAVDLDADFTFAGGSLLAVTDTPSGADKLHNKVTLYYGDGTTEAYDTYIISDAGDIAPTAAFAGLTTGAAFKAELLKWNYEQVATASEFSGRKIDLVVEPKILIKSGLIK